MNSEQARQLISEVLASQIQAVLATQSQYQPYTSLMAFTETDDLKRILLATYRETYKYSNLMANGRAALLIDNRTCQASDHYNAVAVTAVGGIAEVADNEKERLLQRYIEKHSTLAEFVQSPDCALLAMQVENYFLVSQFHNVITLSMQPS